MVYAAVTLIVACSFDRGDRWLPRSAPEETAACTAGQRRCTSNVEKCVDGSDGPLWQVVERCEDRDLVCAPSLLACTHCQPNQVRCNGADAERCAEDGSGFVRVDTCEGENGLACREGGCVNLCFLASEERSNVGCEYWAVDLDNADIDESLNAAAQQFAVVISNPEPDVSSTVTIEQDDTAPGEAGNPVEIARATIAPFSLQVFKLGPREVDGSPAGEFNTGTNTALTRAAYRIRTSVPVVVYQFNPLENVDVFSNDASLLKPVEALGGSDALEPAYVVLGWPQTIASTENPDTNFSPTVPTDLRAFLTIVGTREKTHVRVTPATRVLGGGPIADTQADGTIEVTVDPFDVVNLETDDFNADFTGSVVESDHPVVVFSGSEASDAPYFQTLSERACCADHLEEQLDPVRTAGKRYIATVSPNRTRAVAQAGGILDPVDAPDYFRVIAVTDAGARIRTTLEAPNSSIELEHRGAFVTIPASRDFQLQSDEPVMLSSVSPSQAAAGVPRLLPGGDPSLLVIPPIEQFRSTYVFLTPDRYNFDFVRIIAPSDADIRFDEQDIADVAGCTKSNVDSFDATADAPFVVYRCQLSFPVIDPSPEAVEPFSAGIQNDGVHEILSSRKIGVLVDGFDRYVSYAYAAGTELKEIVAR